MSEPVSTAIILQGDPTVNGFQAPFCTFGYSFTTSKMYIKTGGDPTGWTEIVGGGTPFPGFGVAPPLVSATSSPGVATTAARSDHTHGSTVADWTLATRRFFACDATNGDDANAGFSDVSQADAGTKAVKTLSRLLAILPRFGQGRACRVAIAAGSYNTAADAQLTLDGLNGVANSSSFNSIMIIGTGTNATAGAVAFAGDVNDENFAGFVTATGMNAGGYNATAFAVDGEGTPTLTARINGGGTPGFPAAPARPVGCRIRFDVATTTVALRNYMAGIIYQAGDVLTLARGLPATPVIGDVFYIEMPGVSGPAATLITGCGQTSGIVNVMQIIGLSLGSLQIERSTVSFTGCESLSISANESAVFFQDAFTDFNLAGAGSVPQIGIRCTRISQFGGQFKATGMVTTSTTATGYFWQDLESMLWERSSTATGWQKIGGTASGLNTLDTIGTNSSTAHGATCQVYGTVAVGSPSLRCGGELAGPGYHARIKYTNMGGNPAVRILGGGNGITLQAPSGSTGNTDVGLDLTPNGLSGNTQGAMACTISLVGTPSVTGTAGDVRLPNGQLTTWAALLATGLADTKGNRFVSTTGPTSAMGFAGGITGSSGATFSYCSPGVPNATNQTTALRTPTSMRMALRLRVTCLSNTSANATTVTLYKNGSPTTMQVSIPAGTAANTKFNDAAHPMLFVDGDDYDIRIDDGAGDGAGAITLSGAIEWAA